MSSLGSKNLSIFEKNLKIYLTNERVNWQRVEELKYDWNGSSYSLSGYEKGVFFKHFVLCDETEKEAVRNYLIKNYNHSIRVTGDGSPDIIQGKWRVWFLDRRFPLTTNIDDVFCNNIEQ